MCGCESMSVSGWGYVEPLVAPLRGAMPLRPPRGHGDNTPGHLNHWTGAGFQRFVSQCATVRKVASPYPWTIVWATKA